ncbi:predicted acetyltransferase [Longilinea arvoryzae]|uniref:Predicted acetyltransferase n=1 Tax=Longilinea arvoryzae TaxID=360412 RepID=A0A0S7B8B5_9CHLR|nr:GNAT family N-acetyltransferase [Longilinea arvoryzae]GAP13743.1 predicted acetyltransferase [Longilinea arvoryzae]
MSALIPFERCDEHYRLSAEIWNAAAGEKLAVHPSFVAYNTQTMPGLAQEGRLARVDGQAAGVVLASAVVLEGPFRGQAWVDVLAVAPQFQHRGIGAKLLAWAEEWLAGQGVTSVRLGGSLNPFAAGLPVELNTQDFFLKRGYEAATHPFEWDVTRSLKDYQPVYPEPLPGADLRPLQPGEEDELITFLKREFPGRWQYEVENFFRIGGHAADFMVLRTEIGVDGFCWMTFADSARPLDRFYMHDLPKPWGQLGPLGVGKGCRGKGFGGALIDAAARHLQSLGIDGSLIDWTSLLGLYAKFGYQPGRQYQILIKTLLPKATGNLG